MANPQSTARIAGHPIHPMLVPFPIAFFTGALACDIAFRYTSNSFWASCAYWLLGAGVVMALVAALAGLTDFAGDRRIRDLRVAWLHAGGNVILVLIEAYNFYIRYDMAGPPATPPYGLALSAIAVVLMLFNGWQGWEMVYRHRVAVLDAPGEKGNRAATKEEHFGKSSHGTPYPPRREDWTDDQRLH
jgi:uncharacterized membrane protein